MEKKVGIMGYLTFLLRSNKLRDPPHFPIPEKEIVAITAFVENPAV